MSDSTNAESLIGFSGRQSRFLWIQRKQTERFLMVDPQQISLVRPKPTGGYSSDAAGGRTVVDANLEVLPAQPCRIIPVQIRSGVSQVTSSRPALGVLTPTKDPTLIGRWNMDVQNGDFFTWNNQDFRITFVYSDRRWMTQCQLDLMGETYRATI